MNPLRYRGYVYDDETGLYYLQSRYYDPTVARFINSDNFSELSENTFVVNSKNLFSYCLNNPVVSIDINGKQSVTIFGGLFSYPQVVSYILSESNYEYNSQFKFSGFIWNQTTGNASKVRMGFYTGSYNGCGWIASYNAIKLMGAKNLVQPKDIIYYFEKVGTILYGAFGVPTWTVTNFFRHIGYYYTVYYSPFNIISEINKKVKSYKACIMAFSHSKGAHYVAVQYSQKNETFYIYNLFSDSTTSKKVKDLEKLFKDYNYSCYYLLCIGKKR